ncbi:pyridoxamine 5'-phosphate oxidase family protein [Glutamicibacter ardleyensis]|uniref:pyridoxamine 5'-phosphate oxidase family protein n=1 Tax=Glutamicibacter ardleyensis TaxID=225894 RepID=UPI003FD47F89
MANEEVDKVIGIINDVRIGMVATQSQGRLVSRPLTVIDVKEDGDLWFFSTAQSDIVREFETQGLVNVSFSGNKEWVSVSGRASVVRDVAKKKELWNPMVETFATDGPESPDTVLLRVDSESAEYWKNPGGAASLVAGWVKHKLTGKNAEPGDSNTVQL